MSKSKEPWLEQTLPALYGRIYLGVAEQRGAKIDEILGQTGLTLSALENPNGRISHAKMRELLGEVLARVGDDGIALEVGMQMPPTVFGHLGFALLCSETLDDVVNLCQRFWPLLSPAVHLSLQRGDEFSVIDVSLIAPIPDPFQHLIYEVAMASFYRGLVGLTEVKKEDIEIWFQFPAPDYQQKAMDIFSEVFYSMPANQFRFRTSLLARRLPLHNPVSLKLAIEQCEKELALLRNDGNGAHRQVMEKLVFHANGYPTVVEVCEQLHMTERTLRRRLEEEGTTFKALLEEVKRRDALRLLDDSQINVQRVATLLGYQDPANFTRAFRKWTGQTPSEYRQLRQTSKG